MKDKIKKFVEDKKETIVKVSTCVAAGALLGALITKGGHKINGVGAMLDSDGNVYVNVRKKNGSAESWSGTPSKI